MSTKRSIGGDSQLPEEKKTTKAVEELPIVTSLGIQRVKGGWVTVLVQTQGDSVVHRELIDEPHDLAMAWERFRIASVKKIYMGVMRS